jgi:hypothetical protein
MTDTSTNREKALLIRISASLESKDPLMASRIAHSIVLASRVRGSIAIAVSFFGLFSVAPPEGIEFPRVVLV